MRCIVLLLLSCIMAVSAAFAEPYPIPDKPVRLLLTSPGGGTNQGMLAIWLRDKLAKQGVTLLIDPRPGASGIIAGEFVARADPDGHMLVLMPSTYVTVTPHLQKMPYDPLVKLKPVIQTFRFSFVFAVSAASPVRTLPDFVKYSREKAGGATYGTFGGIGGGQHLSGELLARLSGARLVHVPYNASNTGLIVDAAENRLDAVFSVTPTLAPFVTAGRMRAIAVTGSRRSLLLPDVPTIGESVPSYAIDGAMVLFAPKDVPQQTLQFLNRTVTEVLGSAETYQRLKSQDVVFVPNTSEQTAAELRSEHARFGALIREMGIKPE